MKISEQPIDEEAIDPGILKEVLILRSHEVETYESCQGGVGHCFPEPAIRFHGDQYEGLRVARICLMEGIRVLYINRKITVSSDGELTTPVWEIVLRTNIPKGELYIDPESQLFKKA